MTKDVDLLMERIARQEMSEKFGFSGVMILYHNHPALQNLWHHVSGEEPGSWHRHAPHEEHLQRYDKLLEEYGATSGGGRWDRRIAVFPDQESVDRFVLAWL